MNALIYMPIFRAKQEEFKVLKSFDFGSNIYPCLEIIKDPIKPIDEKSRELPLLVRKRNFANFYIKLLDGIASKHIFVDIPVHLERSDRRKPELVEFSVSVIRNRSVRTDFMKELVNPRRKVIPVISTYWDIANEANSITLQANDLRPDFAILAFRTFPNSFLSRDLQQIKNSIQPDDYIIMDWGDDELDLMDDDQKDILNELQKMKCNIIVHRNPIPKEITNVGLIHGELIEKIDNSLLAKFRLFKGTAFSDCAGIKKDKVEGGGVVSPGFIYYDAVNNEFYGFRFKYGGHRKGQIPPDIGDFERIIVPDIIDSEATKRMQEDDRDFLGDRNLGWQLIGRIDNREESGKSAAKFKRIGMEHYLYCIRTRIENGDFS